MVKKAIRLCPIATAWYHYALGIGYEKNGELEQAITTYRLAYRSDRSCTSGVLLTSALIIAGRLDEARELLPQALEKDPDFFTRRKAWWLEEPSDVIRGSGLLNADDL